MENFMKWVFKSVAGVLFVLLIAPLASQAQWSQDINENNIISWWTTYPAIIGDGEGGVIVVGESYTVNPPHVYAQRVSADGHLLWPGESGVQVADIYNEQWLRMTADNKIFFVSDDSGGCYIAFNAVRFLGYFPGSMDHERYAMPLYVQRIDANGQRRFGDTGLRLTAPRPDTARYAQKAYELIKDGEGGLYIFWRQMEDELWPEKVNNMHLARISRSGKFIWGPIIFDSAEGDYYLLLWLDDQNYLNAYWMAGETYPPGLFPDYFVKFNKDDGSDLVRKKIEIGTGAYGFNGFQRFCQSDAGSAIFVFNGFRSDSLQIQKLDSNGNKLWGEEPVLITTEKLWPHAYFSLAYDFAGGAYVWYVLEADTAIHLVHINESGAETWQKIFEKLPTNFNPGKATWPNVFESYPIYSNRKGNFFFLQDRFQRMLKFNREGEQIWEIQYTRRRDLDIVASVDHWAGFADGRGGLIMVWREVGAGFGDFHGIRGQRVNSDGELGDEVVAVQKHHPNPPEVFALKTPWPNPFSRRLRIRFHLTAARALTIKIYDILGKEVITLIKKRFFPPGSHRLQWDARNARGALLPAGVYFVVLQSAMKRISQKVVLMP